jgi:hypothetical protein
MCQVVQKRFKLNKHTLNKCDIHLHPVKLNRLETPPSGRPWPENGRSVFLKKKKIKPKEMEKRKAHAIEFEVQH